MLSLDPTQSALVASADKSVKWVSRSMMLPAQESTVIKL